MGLRIIQQILYRTTGIMGKKLRMQTCEDIGKALIDGAKEGRAVNIDETMKLLQQKLRTKDFKKIVPSDNREDGVNFAMKALGYSEEFAQQQVNSPQVLAMVIPSIKDGKSMLLLPKETISAVSASNSASYATHELQHLLYSTISLNSKMGKSLRKIIGEKRSKNIQDTFGETAQHNYMSIYMNKVIRTPNASVESFQKYIQENFARMIGKHRTTKDVIALDGVRSNILDEGRSFAVQGRVFSYGETGDLGHRTTFDVVSKGMETAAAAIKKERNATVLNRLRRFFGIKEKLPKGVKKEMETESRFMSDSELPPEELAELQKERIALETAKETKVDTDKISELNTRKINLNS